MAALTVIATIVSAALLRRTGKSTVEQARRAADAAQVSADAAQLSATAAQDSVGLNRETAADLAARAHADAMAKRYQDAAEQLGHRDAPVRLAGAYAMARLADDWPSERQTCVDVLCAYLRMPSVETARQSLEGDQELRRTITQIIVDHIRLPVGDDRSWSSLNLDFTHAVFTDAALLSCRFDGRTSFRGATFRGRSFIDSSRFALAPLLALCRIEPEGLTLAMVEWEDAAVHDGGVVTKL